MAQPTQLGSIGHKGEQLAVKYLANKGFTVVDTNVAYKFGEIDVVAVKDDKYHFIEVKALSVQSKFAVALSERIGKQKLDRIKKSVQQYIVDNDLFNKEVQIDAMLVKINEQIKQARIKFIQNIS